MKKLIGFLGLLLVVQYGIGQVSNVAELRIQNATTALGKNLSVGNKIFNLADSTYYAVTAPIASTATITTGIANLYRIDGKLDSANVDNVTAILKIYQNGNTTPFSVDLAGIIPGAQDLSYNSGTHSIDISGGGTSAIIPLAVDDGATEGLASFTATDFNVTAGNVAIDYANGQEATDSQDGFMSSTYAAKLDGIDAGAEVNLDASTETFTEDDGTPTAHSLAHTAVTAQGCRVSLNGATLNPADYTLTTTTLTLDGPVYQYDEVTITYWY